VHNVSRACIAYLKGHNTMSGQCDDGVSHESTTVSSLKACRWWAARGTSRDAEPECEQPYRWAWCKPATSSSHTWLLTSFTNRFAGSWEILREVCRYKGSQDRHSIHSLLSAVQVCTFTHGHIYLHPKVLNKRTCYCKC
jgi:hypothetical protein